MKCLKCGMELPEGSKFCIQCGTKVGNESDEMKTENVKEERTTDSHSAKQTKENSKGRNVWTSIKNKICQEWRKLSLFGKIMTIAIIICTLLCFIAFACDKILAGIITIMQLGLWIVGWLMKKQIIKTKKTYIYIVLIVLAFVLFVPYFSLMSASKESVTDFSDLSYDNDTESTETLSDLVWPDSELADLLPMPKSTKGYVLWEYVDEVSVYVGETAKEDYVAYKTECIEKGFSAVTSEGDNFYNANNESGYRLSLSYQEEQAMVIKIQEPLYIVQVELSCMENLLFSKYDVTVYVDGKQVGTLEHGATDVFETELESGSYTIKVVKEDSESVDGTVTIDVAESAKFVYSIQCESDQVKITEEYVETLGTLADGQVKIPQSAEEYCSEIYADVVSELSTAGFTNIKENVIRDLTGGWLDTDGDIEEISVDGRTDFRKAEIFDSDVEIIITYHTFELSSEEMWDKITDKSGQNASDIVKSFEGTGYSVICYVGGEIIDDFSPEGYIFEDGWLETDVYCIMKLPKVAERNGEKCISKLEKNAEAFWLVPGNG